MYDMLDNLGTFGLLLLVIFGCAFFSVANFDLATAHGQQQGYIFYQEKYGIFHTDRVCFRESPYAVGCEFYDPLGQKYEAGKYNLEYDCVNLVWAWEGASECRIVNATRIGDLEFGAYIVPKKP